VTGPQNKIFIKNQFTLMYNTSMLCYKYCIMVIKFWKNIWENLRWKWKQNKIWHWRRRIRTGIHRSRYTTSTGTL
jgi:hypothetical protein